jgi:hypothetical protein
MRRSHDRSRPPRPISPQPPEPDGKSGTGAPGDGRRAPGRDHIEPQHAGGDSIYSGDSSSRPEVIGRGGRDFSHPSDAPDSGRRTAGRVFHPPEYHGYQLHQAEYEHSHRGNGMTFSPSYGEDWTPPPPVPATRGEPYDDPNARGGRGHDPDGPGYRGTHGYRALSTSGPPKNGQPYRRPPTHVHDWGDTHSEPRPWDGDDDGLDELPPNPTALRHTSNLRGQAMYRALRGQAHNEAKYFFVVVGGVVILSFLKLPWEHPLLFSNNSTLTNF